MAERYRSTFNPYDNLSPVMKDSQGNLETGLNVVDTEPVIVAGTGANSMRYLTATAAGTSSIAIGHSALSDGASSIILGANASCPTNATNAIAIGSSAVASAPSSITVGAGSISSTNFDMCIGHGSTASGNYAYAIGQSMTNSLANSCMIGAGTLAWARFAPPGSYTNSTGGVASTSPSGTITASGTINAGSYEVVNVTNPYVTNQSTILLTAYGDTGAACAATLAAPPGSGTFDVYLWNTSTGSATSSTPFFTYHVLGGA